MQILIHTDADTDIDTNTNTNAEKEADTEKNDVIMTVINRRKQRKKTMIEKYL